MRNSADGLPLCHFYSHFSRWTWVSQFNWS